MLKEMAMPSVSKCQSAQSKLHLLKILRQDMTD